MGESNYKTLSFELETQRKIIGANLIYTIGKRISRIIILTIEDPIINHSLYNFNHLVTNDFAPTTEIYRVNDEQQVLKKIIEIVVDLKPDYICGYRTEDQLYLNNYVTDILRDSNELNMHSISNMIKNERNIRHVNARTI